MTSILTACQGSLRILEAALMDQEGMNGTFCGALSLAFELEEVDLTGDSSIGDEGLSILPKGELKNEETRSSELIGLPKLKVIKLGGLVKITDHAVMKLVATSKHIEHIELTKCEALTEYSIDHIIK